MILMQRFCLLSLLVLFSAGCGGGVEQPTMYNLKGKVTFDGQPLENGMIYFDPAEAGTGKHAGFSPIKDGAFDTSSEDGKGHAGGKILVRVKAYGPPSENDEPTVAPFDEWSEAAELPTEDSEKDFAVPKSAADKKPAKQLAPGV